METRPIVKASLQELEIEVDDKALEKLDRFADLLVKKNEVMNLTNITDNEGVAIRHFVDSLVVLPFLDSEKEKQSRKNLSVIDVGTGAGFPGVPLKIADMDLQMTLLDSLMKRLDFIDKSLHELGVTDVDLIHMRAEDGGSDKSLRERFDVSIGRAVAPLQVLAEYCIPFVRVGGVFIAMKAKCDEEIEASRKAIKIMGGKIENIHRLVLPGTDMERTIIVIRKVERTPKGYPRQAGKPSKNPL